MAEWNLLSTRNLTSVPTVTIICTVLQRQRRNRRRICSLQNRIDYQLFHQQYPIQLDHNYKCLNSTGRYEQNQLIDRYWSFRLPRLYPWRIGSPKNQKNNPLLHRQGPVQFARTSQLVPVSNNVWFIESETIITKECTHPISLRHVSLCTYAKLHLRLQKCLVGMPAMSCFQFGVEEKSYSNRSRLQIPRYPFLPNQTPFLHTLNVPAGNCYCRHTKRSHMWDHCKVFLRHTQCRWYR